MQIDIEQTDRQWNYNVNEYPLGYVGKESIGAGKSNYYGVIGSTRVFTGVRNQKAAHAEMVKHISELHRKWTTKGHILDQGQNPFRKLRKVETK